MSRVGETELQEREVGHATYRMAQFWEGWIVQPHSRCDALYVLISEARTLHALCTPNATCTLHPTPHNQTRHSKTDSILLEDLICIAQHKHVALVHNKFKTRPFGLSARSNQAENLTPTWRQPRGKS